MTVTTVMMTPVVVCGKKDCWCGSGQPGADTAAEREEAQEGQSTLWPAEREEPVGA